MNLIKNICLLVTLLLLNGCAESVGPTRHRRLKRQNSSIFFTSTISYGIKKQTGKTPLEHAVAYAEV